MKHRGLLLALWLLSSTLAVTAATATAAERILDFHSGIEIRADSSMVVTERITVMAEGRQIRRGIYRDFPTDYRDGAGNRYRVRFEVEAAQRNGRREPFRTERRANGVRVYLGDPDRTVRPGRHEYVLRYETDRQLGYFDDHDELYWNVTGTGWGFPIEKASAEVWLPRPVAPSELTVEGYTGPDGSKARNLVAEVTAPGIAEFRSTRPLAPGEGLTIVFGWPKGVVEPPSASRKLGWLLRDNLHLLAGGAGLLIVAGYYLLVWLRVGRDPEAGVVIAEYEPPPGYSPAAMRYIDRMGYDHKCFTAALINLAVKGAVELSETGGQYSVTRTQREVELAPGERELMKVLFSRGDVLVLEQVNHAVIGGAIDRHKQSLSNDFEKRYFLTNRGYFALGAALTVLIAGTMMLLLARTGKPEVLFLILWSTVWWGGTGAALLSIVNRWRNAAGMGSVLAAAAATAFMLPFVGAGVFVVGMVMAQSSVYFGVILLGLVALNFVFYELLKAPTRLGRRLLDKVEGFRLYVDLAEKHELDYKYPGGRCPELFEKYLPYAVALGFEQQWADQFAAVLARAKDAAGHAYRPAWYHGSHWNAHNLSGFTSAVGGSLASAIASSSTAPGSSSGGGGGGSSGGGGGGGGGGGW